MATPTSKILYRHYLPGPGWTTGGTPKQGKTMVWGELTGTYDGAVNVTPATFGLSKIDHISVTVTKIAGSDVAAGEVAGATYRPSAGTLELFSDASTELTSQTFTATFFACGDSANDVESLA